MRVLSSPPLSGRPLQECRNAEIADVRFGKNVQWPAYDKGLDAQRRKNYRVGAYAAEFPETANGHWFPPNRLTN
jgi:hypothetical protein